MREILDVSRTRDSHRNVGHQQTANKKEKSEMKSIYKTTVFIIGIAMLSLVFVACSSSDERGHSGCTSSGSRETAIVPQLLHQRLAPAPAPAAPSQHIRPAHLLQLLHPPAAPREVSSSPRPHLPLPPLPFKPLLHKLCLPQARPHPLGDKAVRHPRPSLSRIATTVTPGTFLSRLSRMTRPSSRITASTRSSTHEPTTCPRLLWTSTQRRTQ